jgi:hypothetical protein
MDVRLRAGELAPSHPRRELQKKDSRRLRVVRQLWNLLRVDPTKWANSHYCLGWRIRLSDADERVVGRSKGA